MSETDSMVKVLLQVGLLVGASLAAIIGVHEWEKDRGLDQQATRLIVLQSLIAVGVLICAVRLVQWLP